MFFETIAKFDTFQFICGTPNVYLLGILQELMSNTGDPNAFKNILCSMIFELGGTSKIREVCEAIRQMYNAYLIDVIDEVLTDEEGQEAYKAAGN